MSSTHLAYQCCYPNDDMLTSTHLANQCCHPYDEKDEIAVNALKDVTLTMNLASIDLIAQCHEYK